MLNVYDNKTFMDRRCMISQLFDAKFEDGGFKNWLITQAEFDIDELGLQRYIDERYNLGLYGWKHPSFVSVRHKQKEFDDYIKHPIDVEEGVVTCRRCGSKKVYSTSIQTRAADEPLSVYAHCVNCRNKWIQNS